MRGKPLEVQELEIIARIGYNDKLGLMLGGINKRYEALDVLVKEGLIKQTQESEESGLETEKIYEFNPEGKDIYKKLLQYTKELMINYNVYEEGLEAIAFEMIAKAGLDAETIITGDFRLIRKEFFDSEVKDKLLKMTRKETAEKITDVEYYELTTIGKDIHKLLIQYFKDIKKEYQAQKELINV